MKLLLMLLSCVIGAEAVGVVLIATCSGPQAMLPSSWYVMEG